MSMLAERKRKQKWSLNPRGKAWSEDSNKFGQKMLEKMGWQQGKGLGANENGITEHVKMSIKNDSQGMGYKESNDQWTEHESNFSALLESLSEGGEKFKDMKLNSLEEKSQVSRARVHYHKFTRGKDLSQYSEKDLANIFGKKNLKEIKINPVNNKEQIEKHEEDNSETNGTNFLFNGGSMKDYFKKKLPNFGKTNGYIIGNNGVLKKDESESENELKPTFGFGFKFNNNKSDNNKSNATFVSYIDQDTVKRKSKYQINDNIFSPRKKIKREKVNENESFGLSNPAFNPMNIPISINKHNLHTIAESSYEEISESCENINMYETDSNNMNNKICKLKSDTDRKKKKNKRKKEHYGEIDVDMMESMEINLENNANIENIEAEQEPEIKGMKKKKKIKNNVENDESINNYSLENNGLTEPVSLVDNNFYEVKIKKKKKNKEMSDEVENIGISNPVFNGKSESSERPTIDKNPYEVKIQKKKKKSNKQKVEENAGLSNPLFNHNMEYDVMENNVICENPYEIKIKKKKKKKYGLDDEGILNPVFEENTINDSLETVDSSPSAYDTSKNKKRKKKLIENLFFSEEILEIPDNYEVKRKKNKDKLLKHQIIDSNTEDAEEAINNISQNSDLNTSNNLSFLSESLDIDNCDLMLNVVSEPIIPKPPKNVGSIERVNIIGKRRKSVRFSDVTQEVIIPNNDDLKRMESEEYEAGIDNMNFDSIKTHVEENMDTISKTLDMYQAEIENDINENKLTTLQDIMIGEIGNPQGENEKLPIGTKLKFKYADFDSKTPMYQINKTGAKKSYKHLIKGDIIVKFQNTNLHELKGYAVKKT